MDGMIVARLRVSSIKRFKTKIKHPKGFIDLILELEFSKQVIQLSHAISNHMSKSYVPALACEQGASVDLQTSINALSIMFN